MFAVERKESRPRVTERVIERTVVRPTLSFGRHQGEHHVQETYPIYVVDDDPSVHDWAQIVCEENGLECRGFGGGDEFLEAVGGLAPGAVLLDMRMPRRSGLEVQAELLRREIKMPVVAMTGYGDIDVAVRCMKMGAVDFLEKPFATEVLMEALEAAFGTLDKSERQRV